MEKEFIPYQQALDLKELGFNEPCFGNFKENQMELYKQFYCYNSDYIEQLSIYIAAPLFSQAFSFFREKHGMSFHISDYYNQESRKLYGRAFQIFINDRQQIFQYSSSSGVELYYTYPEAELACLIKLIEIVKEKK